MENINTKVLTALQSKGLSRNGEPLSMFIHESIRGFPI